MTPDDFKRNFSMPAGAPLYGAPPYLYRGVEDIFIRYEADTDAVRQLLPPHVEPIDDPVICTAWARWVPFSSFGPYHEAYVMVHGRFRGTDYLYQPVIMVDSEVPLAAGREIWGYAKKLAHFDRSWGDSAAVFGEQLLFRVERPRRHPLMTASIICDRKVSPEDLGEDLPVLSCRVIPASEPSDRPRVAELVRLDVAAHLHKSADGSAHLYSGRSHLDLAGSAGDPWHLLAPTRILSAHYAVLDFDLTLGKVAHDYLSDEGLWR